MSDSNSVLRELQRQREEVAASLEVLDKKRAETVQNHSFAHARERAGVGEPSAETAQLKADETAAHAAMRDARAELNRLDVEIAGQPRPGLRAKLRTALRRGDR